MNSSSPSRLGKNAFPAAWRGFTATCRSFTVAGLAALILGTPADADQLEFAARVDPFAKQHCYGCHDARKEKGDFRLDELSRDLSDPAVAVAWQDAIDLVRNGEMPPPDQPRPDGERLREFVEAVEAALRHEAARGNRSQRIQIRRLSHSALDHTVADLLGTRLKISDGLPADPEVAGFDNMAMMLGQSEEFLDKLQRNARRLVGELIVEGDDPRSHQDYGIDRLDRGVRVVEQDDLLVTWSSKNRFNCLWPKRFVAPRYGLYRLRLTAFQKDNRNDLLDAGIDFQPVDKHWSLSQQKDKYADRMPREKPRMVAIKAAVASEVYSEGGESTGGRQVGLIQLTESLQEYEVDCVLEQGENLFLHAIDCPRMQNHPWAMVEGKKVIVGEALYVQSLELEGPITGDWPPQLHRQLLKPADPEVHPLRLPGRELTGLDAFMFRAFRGPIEPATRDRYVRLFEVGISSGLSRQAAMRNVVEAILCSPRFLYNYDRHGAKESSTAAWSLASRLSYFLWNSMPDDELYGLAASGRLLQPEVIEAQARRMLDDEKADRFVVDFAGQWLGLRRVGAMLPDPNLYPSYDIALERSIRGESEALFRKVLRDNRPITDLLDPGYAMLNERLARHYDIPGVVGRGFRPVALPPDHPRGGLLGHASMLTITSNGTRTSPVVRGVWVLENLLDSPPQAPPPDVEPIEPDVRGAATVREMLAKHRDIETCNECHRRIDPWGFGLENFDAIGAWRTHAGRDGVGKPIDSSGTLADGRSFEGVVGLREALLSKPERFTGALASKLFAHAVGHPTTPSEEIALDELVKTNLAAGGRLGDLIVSICKSDAFRGTPARPTDD